MESDLQGDKTMRMMCLRFIDINILSSNFKLASPKRSFLVVEERLRDEPKERLRGRLISNRTKISFVLPVS